MNLQQGISDSDRQFLLLTIGIAAAIKDPTTRDRCGQALAKKVLPLVQEIKAKDAAADRNNLDARIREARKKFLDIVGDTWKPSADDLNELSQLNPSQYGIDLADLTRQP